MLSVVCPSLTSFRGSCIGNLFSKHLHALSCLVMVCVSGAWEIVQVSSAGFGWGLADKIKHDLELGLAL